MTVDNPWLRAQQPVLPPGPPLTQQVMAATGPAGPQPLVSAPPAGLPLAQISGSASLWVVGAHGGAGESTIAGLHGHWRGTGRTWPVLPGLAPCILVARTHA
jgi:hypothetical protein